MSTVGTTPIEAERSGHKSSEKVLFSHPMYILHIPVWLYDLIDH